jgi:glycosyltransferase involved in cell wall biosynthesis
MAVLPFISVVIATRNRSALLARTLDALAIQTWRADRFEVIVADNGSTDGTRAIVEAIAARSTLPRVKYLFVPEPGKSHAVNRALDVGAGEIFAFTDDDVLPERDWLTQASAALSRQGVSFMAGRVLPIWEAPPPPWLSRSLYGVLAVPDSGDLPLEIGPDSTDVVPIGANMAVRREVIARVGGLRTDLGKLEGSLRTGEDHEFFLRILEHGFRGVYDPTAVVRHVVPRERLERGYFKQWLKQNGRDVATLGDSYAPRAPRLFGVPRYLWRQAFDDMRAFIRAALADDPADRFAAQVRLLWLGSYAHETWFGKRTATS